MASNLRTDSTANAVVFVCQRCFSPLQLDQDFKKLQKTELLTLIDALKPDEEESDPFNLIPFKNPSTDVPRYLVPPNPNLSPLSDDEDPYSLLHSYSGPTSSLDHRLKVNATLFDLLSGRTDVDHPLCHECADTLLIAKQQCLEFQEEELNCLQSYLKYLDSIADKAEARLKTQSKDGDRSGKLLTGSYDPDSSNESNSLTFEDEKLLVTNDEQNKDNKIDGDIGQKDKDRDEVTDDSDDDDGDDETDSLYEESDGASSDEGRLYNMLTGKGTSQLITGANRDKRTVGFGTRRPRLSELSKAVEDLQVDCARLLDEGAKLDAQIAKDTAELERRTAELEKATTEYNERKQTLLESEEELLSLEAHLNYAVQHLQRLRRTNVLNIAFPIWYDGHIGIINGLHLGRLSNRPVGWEEINAAWGQCALLLQCIGKKLKYTFQNYRIIPMGSQSKIIQISNRREYPLYYPTSGMRLFSSGKPDRFDTAMVAFLDCLNQVQQIVKNSSDLQLPYRIGEGGVLHDQDDTAFSIRWERNSEENWTKALKMMLMNLKWTIVALTVQRTQRKPIQSDHLTNSDLPTSST